MTTFAPEFSFQTYDIFSGSDSDALWLESVDGLTPAVDRMNALAADMPGLYFVFGGRDRKVIARADTRNRRTATA